jgi:hypothetical protein
MLCAEVDCNREIFKSCCHSDGTFDYAQFHSYCNRLRLIHDSLCCGLLVALHAILDQFRVWLQIGATTKNTGQAFLPDTREYNEKLRQHVMIMQRLEQDTDVVRFPDAVALAQDTSLMREIHTQHNGTETQSTEQENILENNFWVNKTETSTSNNAVDVPVSTMASEPSSHTAQKVFEQQTDNSSMQKDTSTAIEQGNSPAMQPGTSPDAHAETPNRGLLDPAGLAEPADLSKCRVENDAGMIDPAVLEDGGA